VSYRPYPAATPALVVRDPVLDLPADHLARLVDQVVDQVIEPTPRPPSRGQPPYNPRLPLKVLLYGYATGVRSSRRLEQLCEESLPYLLLTRGDTPSYRTLCSVRVAEGEALEQVFVALLALAASLGMKRVGHLVVDTTKLRADASPEAVLCAEEYEAVGAELGRILQEVQLIDEQESREGYRAALRLGQEVTTEQMRDIVRRVRKAKGKPSSVPNQSEAADSQDEEATIEKGGPRARRPNSVG
jgi:transposase